MLYRTLILILLKFIVPFSVMWGRTHRFLCFDQYCGELKDTTRFNNNKHIPDTLHLDGSQVVTHR